MQIDELILISEQIKFFKKRRHVDVDVPTIESVMQMTSTSKSNWADEVIKERDEQE